MFHGSLQKISTDAMSALERNYTTDLNTEFPRENICILYFWYRSMVSNVEEFRTRKKSFVKKVTQRCFDIERVYLMTA